MSTLILSISLVLWCNNVMIKHIVGLLKQLPCFVNTEVKFRETQDWRNIKLMKRSQEEKSTGRALQDENQKLKVGNLTKPSSQ